MRLIYIILLISSIASEELVFDKVLFEHDDISLIDNPMENQSEKENQDASEEESKIDYFPDDQSFAHFIGAKYNSILAFISLLKRTPYLEIHSPPPE